MLKLRISWISLILGLLQVSLCPVAFSLNVQGLFGLRGAPPTLTSKLRLKVPQVFRSRKTRAAATYGDKAVGVSVNECADEDACDWECEDESASCVLVPLVAPRVSDRFVVRFDDKWIDLTSWRKAHPAGAHWIDAFKDLDATEPMYAFHSDKAIQMLQRLPKAKDKDLPVDGPIPTTPLQAAFRKFRGELIEDGWFKRRYSREAWHIASWAGVLALGLGLVRRGSGLPLWARALGVFPLAIANTYAGWVAHDYVHGVDRMSNSLRHFGAYAAGLGTTMWSDKHNMHHAKTNEVGVDEDLPGGPVLFVWPPSPENEKPWRKFQHLYLPFAYSLLFVVWRIDSVKVAWKRKLSPELLGLAVHYAWVAALIPIPAFLSAVLLSGLISATIVTVSHQNEVLQLEHNDDWVLNQFQSTRDCITATPFSEWLWGGMQYQLPHHLFPTMPRYKYRALVPLIQKFANANGIEYRTSEEFPLLRDNYGLYRNVAKAPADQNARQSKAGLTC